MTGHRKAPGNVSGEPVHFIGRGMATVVFGIREVQDRLDESPVVVGGLAVLSRLSQPYRATTDLDLVDRGRSTTPILEVLRAHPDTTPEEPAAVELPTALGRVRVDVLEVRQIELDDPSSDPGDRLHASSHAWAHETATPVRVVAVFSGGDPVSATVRMAEPGPLVAMKLQALMDRTEDKRGTDLLDLTHLILDRATRRVALEQISAAPEPLRRDLALHVQFWLQERAQSSLNAIHRVGGIEISDVDLDLVAELLMSSAVP